MTKRLKLKLKLKLEENAEFDPASAADAAGIQHPHSPAPPPNHATDKLPSLSLVCNMGR
jgi:hypothetical protein